VEVGQHAVLEKGVGEVKEREPMAVGPKPPRSMTTG